MAKRSRPRRPAPAALAAPAAPAARPSRRFTLTLAVTFGAAALVAGFAPATGPALAALAVVLAAAVGAARAGRALGLPPGLAAAPAAGAAYALLVAVGAALRPGLVPGYPVPGLAAAALGGLLVADAVAAPPPARPSGARLGAALRRGHAARLGASGLLVALAARGVYVGLAQRVDGALALALLALLATALLWWSAGPAPTLLATLLLGLVPGVLALATATGCGLWPPVTGSLAAAVGTDPAAPGLLAGASLGGALGCWALALAAAPPAAAAAA